MATATVKVVGIGASAGGLSALEALFKAMPTNTGQAFVVVQHLSPDFKSLMDDLLGRHTTMPVKQATEGKEVRPNTIYLIPPKKLITLSEGKLVLTDRDTEKTPELPIDIFLESLAKDQGAQATAIILSGTGSDGSKGVRAINEHGGMVIVQDPESAQFDGMPRNAIATECYDFIARPEDMPEIITLPLQDRRDLPVQPPPLTQEEEASSYATMFTVLRKAFGVDFSSYKHNTVQRRILRRMVARKCDNLTDYALLLARDPQEADDLYQNLLIGVTEFFRDPEVWRHLEDNILPGLFQEANRREFRAWCAGCASGEEVYTMAMVLDEVAAKVNYPGKITIFGTDLHRGSLEKAGQAVYNEEVLGGVTQRRRQRYFTKESANTYRIINDLRGRIVFAPQNLLNDPPFTKLDLVTCRNLLIYLEPNAQERVLRQMHYGLRKGGILLLGSSESIGNLDMGFATEHTRLKFFRKHSDTILPLEIGAVSRTPSRNVAQAPAFQPRLNVQMPRQLLRDYDYLLAEYLPTGAILNEAREVEHYFGQIDRYLQARTGRSSVDFLDNLIPDLSLPVTSLLQQALREERTVLMRGIRVTKQGGDEDDQLVDISVEPLPGDSRSPRHVFVGITDVRQAPPVTTAVEVAVGDSQKENGANGALQQQRIRDLELELQATRENLQASIEELQTSNEELQATNEELLASNEELQSTNEELQSVNEELYTVNSEYDRKNQELKQLNDDLSNLLNSLVDIGIVYVDDKRRIRKFNPAIESSFKLMPQDIGRPIEHISYLLEDQDGLIRSIDAVLDKGESQTEEIRTKQGQWLLKRIEPYFISPNEQAGAILTFKDITDTKRAYDRLELAMNTSRLVWWEWDLASGSLITHAAGWCILGYDLECLEPSYDTWIKLTHPDDLDEVKETLNAHLQGKSEFWNCEHRLKNREGNYIWVLNQGSITRRAKDGKPLRMVGTTMDIQDRKQAELSAYAESRTNEELRQQAEKAAEQARLLARDAESASLAKSQFLATMSHELRTPLNPIIGFSELLADTLKNDEERQHAKIIHTAGENLLSLIGDILDFSRLGRDHIVLNLEPLDILMLLDEVLAMAPRKHSVQLRRTTLKGLNGKRYVRADTQRLRQVLLNLVGNASKFTEQGQITIDCVRHEPSSKSGGYPTYAFSVNDTGIGIDPKDQKRIFEPFTQADASNTRKFGGSGLGLSICRSLVEAMDGTLGVESEPGVGSTFTFTLPLQEAKLEDLELAASSELEPIRAIEDAAILLVEDHEPSRLVFEGITQSLGYHITSTSNAAEALELIAEKPRDIIFMDLSIPDMDGLTATRIIREQHSNGHRPAIIAVTAHASDEVRRECLHVGMDDFITKPITMLKISRCLNRWAAGGYEAPTDAD